MMQKHSSLRRLFLSLGFVLLSALGLAAQQPADAILGTYMTEGGKARVMINPSVDQFPTTENGMTVNGDLLMSINGRTK